MATIVGKRASSLEPVSLGSADTYHAAPSAGSHSVGRRLIERFAFIAFALYHVPLFLNNYPSLGGGGFNDDGLAPRWGHVFTSVGIWVARHVFGMTGPMTSARAGDNGDVGEEFGRLLVAVVIGVVGAVAWMFADKRRERGRWVSTALPLLLRYSIALGLTSYAIAKLLPQQFPPLTASSLEVRLGEMAPMTLLWRFMAFSRPYNFFAGAMEMIAVLLLCFRRTATLGALVTIVVMTNVAFMNWAYGVPVKLYATMTVLSAVVLVLYDARRLLAVFVTNRVAEPAVTSPSFLDRINPATRWTIKVLVVGSVIVSSIVAMTPAAQAAARPKSPVDGAWLVTSFVRDGQRLDSTANAARWRRVVINANLFGIRFETDSMRFCGRAESDDPNTLVLSCRGNTSAHLRWTRTADTLSLEGDFGQVPVSAKAQRVRYPLMETPFRLITDR